MEQILVEQVLSEFPMEQQVKETHPQPLVISDIILLQVSLKATLMSGVRLVDLVVYQKHLHQFQVPVQQAQVVLQ